MEYIYKVKHKFTKNRKEFSREIEKFSFLPYVNEQGEEEVYAIGVRLKNDSPIVENAIKLLEHFYKNATEEQKEQDFSNFNFENGLFVRSEENIEKIAQCQLCFATKGKTANTLFINGPDAREYYNASVIYSEISPQIDFLLTNKVIYKAKSDFNWKVIK